MEEPAQFFAAAAEAMQWILIDRARRRQAERHGGGVEKVSVNATGFDVAAPAMGDAELLLLHAALDALAVHDPRKAELVKQWYFVWLSLEDIAAVLGISARTADRDLAYAKGAGSAPSLKRLAWDHATLRHFGSVMASSEACAAVGHASRNHAGNIARKSSPWARTALPTHGSRITSPR